MCFEVLRLCLHLLDPRLNQLFQARRIYILGLTEHSQQRLRCCTAAGVEFFMLHLYGVQNMMFEFLAPDVERRAVPAEELRTLLAVRERPCPNVLAFIAHCRSGAVLAVETQRKIDRER